MSETNLNEMNNKNEKQELMSRFFLSLNNSFCCSGFLSNLLAHREHELQGRNITKAEQSWHTDLVWCVCVCVCVCAQNVFENQTTVIYIFFA